MAMSLVRPVMRVILKPASFASVPELLKNTLAGVRGALAVTSAPNFSASAI